jgi:hypothetical protein
MKNQNDIMMKKKSGVGDYPEINKKEWYPLVQRRTSYFGFFNFIFIGV